MPPARVSDIGDQLEAFARVVDPFLAGFLKDLLRHRLNSARGAEAPAFKIPAVSFGVESIRRARSSRDGRSSLRP